MLWAIENKLVGAVVTIVPAIPRSLASALAGGAYDAAIVPVFEYFRHPELYTYVPGPVIASRGEVHSVFLYSADTWTTLKTVYLDKSSLTSVNLFKVLAAEKGVDLRYVDTSEQPVPYPLPPGTGWVVIGDPAIAEWGRHPHTLDLGLAWKELTGLPFVFAAWLVPHGVRQPGLAALLSESLRLGLANLQQVCNDSAARFGVTPEFALRYFTRYLHYHLGYEELAGWAEFGRLLYKHGLISVPPPLRPYTADR